MTFLFGQEGWEKLIYMSKVLKSEKNSLNVKEKTIFFLKHTCAMNIFKTRPFTESEHRDKTFVFQK